MAKDAEMTQIGPFEAKLAQGDAKVPTKAMEAVQGGTLNKSNAISVDIVNRLVIGQQNAPEQPNRLRKRINREKAGVTRISLRFSGPDAKVNGRPTKTQEDSGSDFNLMSPLLAKELNLTVQPSPKMAIWSYKGPNLTLYGTTMAKLEVSDSRKQKRTYEVEFIVTKTEGYEILLGKSWLKQVNPIIDRIRNIIKFRNPRSLAKAAPFKGIVVVTR
ncbi:MAG: hypothetical protein M1822_003163 [Bathelium mastoideum]|nr:MAG: hypothetical protein M1822_003163 [Bathelium mastoideum]